MIVMEGQVCGHVGDEFSPSLCLVFFFFFTVVSNGVDRMRLQCGSEGQSGEKAKASADKRQEKP